jgi:hypothetical protein
LQVHPCNPEKALRVVAGQPDGIDQQRMIIPPTMLVLSSQGGLLRERLIRLVFDNVRLTSNLGLLRDVMAAGRQCTTISSGLFYIGHAFYSSLQILVTHRTTPKHHPIVLLEFRLSSQGLNTGSNPVGNTTPSSQGSERLIGYNTLG